MPSLLAASRGGCWSLWSGLSFWSGPGVDPLNVVTLGATNPLSSTICQGKIHSETECASYFSDVTSLTSQMSDLTFLWLLSQRGVVSFFCAIHVKQLQEPGRLQMT